MGTLWNFYHNKPKERPVEGFGYTRVGDIGKKNKESNMARLNANPNAEASVDFQIVKPCVARMRVAAIEEAESKTTPGNMLWKLRAEFADPMSLVQEDGSPVTNAGGVFDNGLVVSPPEKQGKVRGFVEACGIQWSGDIDSDNLIGLEFDARIAIETYQGNKKNVIARYVKK